MNPKKLFLQNDNNKLACNCFLQIHFAPPRRVAESEMSQVYSIEYNGENLLLEMAGMIRLPFSSIGSVFTLPATGKESQQWSKEWKDQYPSTTDATSMAVYMYRRVMGDV